ncbi:MAG: IS3 family transposase [Deltaproteobacteria bacterium]|nr:MAG: IS3 family transposase [Deltaproteobacteria bacterium]
MIMRWWKLFHTLKVELVYRQKYSTREEARRSIEQYKCLSITTNVCIPHWAIGAPWSLKTYTSPLPNLLSGKSGSDHWRRVHDSRRSLMLYERGSV